jgi:hypothetical protein
MTINKQELDQAGKSAPALTGQEIATPLRASRRRLTNDGATNPADVMPAAASADDMAAKFSKRRRFKVGASTVPVALTLTSQPVLAWHCNSTSAWGSGQMQNNTGSVKARNDATRVVDECYSYSDWKSNNGSVWCNSALNCAEIKPSKIDSTTIPKFDNCVGWQWNTTSGKQAKTDGTLTGSFNKGKMLTCNDLGVNTSLVKGDAKVWDLLNSGSNFQKCIAVAMLNEKCFPKTVGACLKTGKTQKSALALMATGSYSPVPGVTWGQTEIMKYLADNWIAV